MSNIVTFVHDALLAGKSRKEIGTALLSAGWREDEVNNALCEFVPVNFPIPVPRRKTGMDARDAFQHLVAFLTLHISAIGAGTLLFQFVNLAIPDSLRNASWNKTDIYPALRGAAACLIIAFPIYLWMTRLLYRAYQADPERRSSPVRKWLTYLTLFAGSAIVICYLIVLVYGFLEGELSVPFLLKVVIVLGITGAIFGYYMPGLRKEERQDSYELKPTS